MQPVSEVVTPEDIPASICADFTRSYPDATDVAWSVSDEYVIASFSTNTSRAESSQHSTVWYWLNDYQKKMHSTPIPFTDLPPAVTTAFYAGEYATLRPSEYAHAITRYGNDNVECIYQIHAKGTLEGSVSAAVKLYYTADGILVKSSSEIIYDESFTGNGTIDELKEWLPHNPADFVSAYVDTYYPGARYLYIYEGQNFTKAKILKEHTVRLLLFDADGSWKSTATEIDNDDIPAEIIAAFSTSEFAGWHIDKAVEHLTSSDGHYYLLSLKNGKNKTELRIEADGTVTDGAGTASDTVNPGNPSGETTFLTKAGIEGFILAKYPGASVLKYDYDDDDAEVEIIYEGHKIRIEFELYTQGYLWSQSEWSFDIRDTASVPAAISGTISDRYNGYRLEYLSYLETAANTSCYEAGLKSSHTKKVIKVKMDEQGNVIAEYGSN